MLTIQHNRVEEKIIPLFTETALDLRFPCGLLGFEQIKSYKLHAFPDIHPFLWLEGQSANGLCFLVAPPSCVVEFYHIELSADDVSFLNLTEPDDAVVLNIATFHPDGSITVNLKGPIVYNKYALIARQVVPKNASILSIKHPLGN
ncbi:MAG: flagellar assembly protein FliW [Verrucomicrobia bacterium]|nr:flagellar assembly protein FliW [Verrucomicrobiota bacterium]